jgi:hypothetical protein
MVFDVLEDIFTLPEGAAQVGAAALPAEVRT